MQNMCKLIGILSIFIMQYTPIETYAQFHLKNIIIGKTNNIGIFCVTRMNE